MKNSKLRRILLTLACAVLLVSLSVGATLAYLTSKTSEVKNTFTVGKVEITLDEQMVDLYGDKANVIINEETGEETRVPNEESDERGLKNTYKLLPGHNYIKDPTIHVTLGSEECYLFVKIVDEIVAIQETKTVATQMAEKGWVALPGVDNVYYYNQVVDARTEAKDVIVFEEFTIKGDADVAAYNGKTITVQAYAVQKDGFANAAAAYTAAPCTWGN